MGDTSRRATTNSAPSGRSGYVINVGPSGYGFIKVRGQALDLFFNQSDLAGGLEYGPELVERFVRFDVTTQADGRPRATNIRPGD